MQPGELWCWMAPLTQMVDSTITSDVVSCTVHRGLRSCTAVFQAILRSGILALQLPQKPSRRASRSTGLDTPLETLILRTCHDDATQHAETSGRVCRAGDARDQLKHEPSRGTTHAVLQGKRFVLQVLREPHR